MFTLLIVDDEAFVRSAVASIIDWQSLGITEVLEAEDGELGLEMALERRPDIVLTDIRMPFMDGLEMAKRINEQLPGTKTVVLTGHDEFEYAVKSIKLGLTDYIMKPVSSATLFQLMQNVVQTLIHEREQKQTQQRLRLQLRQSVQLLKEKTLNQLVTKKTTLPELREKLQYLDLDIAYQTYTICVFEVGDTAGRSVEDCEVLNLMFKERLESRFSRRGIVFSNHQNQHILLYKDVDPLRYDERAALHNAIEENNRLFKSEYVCYVNTGLGSTVTRVEDICESYALAQKAINYNTALGNDIIFDFAELGHKVHPFRYPSELIAELLKTVSLNISYDEKLSQLMRYLSGCEDLTAHSLRIISFDIINSVNKALIEMDMSDLTVYETVLEQTKDINTVLDFERFTKDFLSRIGQVHSERNQNRKQLIVHSAKQYIEANYMDTELDLNAVANNVFVSPSYLSALFKKETGISFVDFLTRLRLDKAKELLTSPSCKAYEAAQRTGYQDPHYFSVCFKKHTGLSPSEYKKLHSEGLNEIVQ